MANKHLFKSTTGKIIPKTDTTNEAGGKAYSKGPELSLATYAMTGTFNDTYYASGKEQLSNTLKFTKKCDPRFIGQLAVYAREKGFMKDMPALLCAHLTTRGDEGREVLRKIFVRVIDNGKMLRNFVQIMRSGVVGRKSLGTFPKKLVQCWFASKTSDYIFRQAVGKNPSIADIIKMVHPKAENPEREALFGYLIGKTANQEALPSLVQQFKKWKIDRGLDMPKVDFRMLTAEPLTSEHWKQIARTAPWHMTRMNLNTFKRHNVLEDTELCKVIAERLRDPETIRKVKVFPYQLLMAYKASTEDLPSVISDALHDALEIATENVPEIPGNVWVFPDVSGSMGSSVTGGFSFSSSVARCIDVAALVGATIKRKNPDARIIPIDTQVYPNARIDSRDTIMTNAQKLAKFGGGGTSLSKAILHINALQNPKADLIVMVSDNQSWIDKNPWKDGTTTMTEFRKLQQRCPKVKMVCLDVQPYETSQAKEEQGTILNIGGFSDRIFEVIANWATTDASSWVKKIKSTDI